MRFENFSRNRHRIRYRIEQVNLLFCVKTLFVAFCKSNQLRYISKRICEQTNVPSSKTSTCRDPMTNRANSLIIKYKGNNTCTCTHVLAITHKTRALHPAFVDGLPIAPPCLSWGNVTLIIRLKTVTPASLN